MVLEKLEEIKLLKKELKEFRHQNKCLENKDKELEQFGETSGDLFISRKL